MNRPDRCLVSLALLVALGACGGEAPDADEPLRSDSEPVFGDTHYDPATCSDPNLRAHYDKTIRWGRIAAASNAYAQCVDFAFRNGVPHDGGYVSGPYRQCIGEPFYSNAPGAIDNQIQRALDAARSPNDWMITCEGGLGNASAAMGGYYDTDNDTFSWSTAVKANFYSLGLPLCSSVPDPGLKDPTDTNGDGYPDWGCRYAPYPWPFDGEAATVWHEAMHQHGYSHGTNDQETAKVACGYPNDPTWDYQVNTAPYILGECIGIVLRRSYANCGDLEAGCYGGAGRLVTGLTATTCECVEDPADDGLGLLSFKAGGLDDLSMVGNGDTFTGGGGVLSASDTVLGVGDLDGDGRSELVLKTSTGWGTYRFDPILKTIVRQDSIPYGTPIGAWTLGASDTLVRVGDFNGDGRDDLLVKSPTRLGILYRISGSSPGAYGALDVYSFGGQVGTWTLAATDTIVGVGDFNADGRDDIVIRNGSAFAILQRLSNGALSTLHNFPQGTWIGSWNWDGPSNQLRYVGDFNGDGRADILVTSPWGLGFLYVDVNGSPASTGMWHAGTAVGSWVLAASDTISAPGDYDGDGRLDFVIRNATSLGIVRWYGKPPALSLFRKLAFGSAAGGWKLAASDVIEAAGDADGNGKDEFLVRSPWGRGLLGDSGAGLTSIAMTPFGGMMGSWPLTAADGFYGFGDFDGDGRDDIVVRR